MRQTFTKLNIEEEKVDTLKGDEDYEQKEAMAKKMSIRDEKIKMGMTGQSFAVLKKGGFDGNIEGEESKKNKKEEPKSILDDDFLGDLKAVDVPDSDDECYF